MVKNIFSKISKNVQPSGGCDAAVNVLHVICFVEMSYKTCAYSCHKKYHWEQDG